LDFIHGYGSDYAIPADCRAKIAGSGVEPCLHQPSWLFVWSTLCHYLPPSLAECFDFIAGDINNSLKQRLTLIVPSRCLIQL